MKWKKEKWLSEEAFQIDEKRREAKVKIEKERYAHLNATFPRVTRGDNMAFLSEQCKEIEENNRMGKTRDLFKKVRDTKGIVHVKMGKKKKDRNCMEQTVWTKHKQKRLRRGGKNTQKNYIKKVLITQIATMV